jgi:4-hydroxythreonine-4-phosphate dehydrogenase
MKPKIAISMGDPGGIGPEVALKAALDAGVRRACRPVLVGNLHLFRSLARPRELRALIKPISGVDELDGEGVGVMDVVPLGGRVPVGKPSKRGGNAAGRAIEESLQLVLSGGVEGLVTAPVSKQSLALAGYGMIGHTELLAGLTGTKTYAMMIYSGRLRVVFATQHVALRRVTASLTKALLLDKLRLARKYLDLYMGIADARIGVACLNPHCGEGGHVGNEDRRIIWPAVKSAGRLGISAEGPFPADCIFRPEFLRRFDAVLAMYHDQGMIPLRLRGFDDVVNVTLGIPCLRTSPGHGTAFDIAGTWRASERSMVRAVVECAKVAKRLRNARRVR